MKTLLIAAFILRVFSPLFSQSDFSDIELISFVDDTIKSSISRLKKMGKPGVEEISGLVEGSLLYSTRLTGFNKVENILEYINFCDREIYLTGSQISHVNWSGTGTSFSEFLLSGMENFSLIMVFSLEKKIPVSGSYIIRRTGQEPREYPYDILGNAK